jgi:hypothetical protein
MVYTILKHRKSKMQLEDILMYKKMEDEKGLIRKRMKRSILKRMERMENCLSVCKYMLMLTNLNDSQGLRKGMIAISEICFIDSLKGIVQLENDIPGTYLTLREELTCAKIKVFELVELYGIKTIYF